MPASDYGQRLVADCATGTITRETLTAAEVSERDALATQAAQETSKKDNLRAAIRAKAASAEGVLLSDLTQAQVAALVYVLLWRAGAVDANERVKPLAEWT